MSDEYIKIYKIFQWNGKDLFIQEKSSPETFVTLSFSELSDYDRERLERGNKLAAIGREVTYCNGKLDWIKTREEIQAEADRRHRRLEIRRDIAGLEGAESNNTEYSQKKLKELYTELAEYEHLDPTALTLEAQRANESITNPTFELKKMYKKIE